MKRLTIVLFAIFICVHTYGQKKNGTVFNEHASIDMTKALWKAFVAGDQEAYAACLADDLQTFRNSDFDNPYNKEQNVKGLKWWASNFSGLSVSNDGEGYPDAIKYGNGELWVQDWLRVKGTHIESGINLDLSLHNVYRMNEDGKIEMMISYFNNDVFEAINSSSSKTGNGNIYIHHPYINKMRKSINAYTAEDIDGLAGFYAEGVSFGNSTLPWKETLNWDKQKERLEGLFEKYDKIHMKQVGYPDCMHYEKGDSYVVYSWWTWTAVRMEDGKKLSLPLMLSQTFNKEGKIVRQYSFYSTNHVE